MSTLHELEQRIKVLESLLGRGVDHLEVDEDGNLNVSTGIITNSLNNGVPLVYKGIASGDFNNLTTEGVYYSNNSMTANAPVGSSNWGYVVVLTNRNMTLQTYYDSYGRVYTRTYSGSPATWQDWISLFGVGKWKQIAYTPYTTTNGWGSVGNINIPKDNLYRIRAAFSNSAVLGLAYGATNNTNILATVRLAEFSTGGSIDNVFFLPAGTWKFWVKCADTGRTNYIYVWQN